MLRSLSNGLRWLFRKERVEGELDEELRGFVEMAAERKDEGGYEPQGGASRRTAGPGKSRAYKGICPLCGLGIFCRHAVAGCPLSGVRHSILWVRL